MNVLTLLIALLALALSVAAFLRTGGVSMLHEQTEDARRMAADALARAEGVMRPHPQGPDPDVPRTGDGRGEE